KQGLQGVNHSLRPLQPQEDQLQPESAAEAMADEQAKESSSSNRIEEWDLTSPSDRVSLSVFPPNRSVGASDRVRVGAAKGAASSSSSSSSSSTRSSRPS